jgi:hypothetical protein
MKESFSSCLAPNGQIYVNDLWQISSVDPRKDPTAQGVRDNIFAYGDVCQTSLNEEKTGIVLSFLVPTLAKNLAQIAHGQKPSNTIPSKLPHLSPVSLGPNFGLMVINGIVASGEAFGKSKFEVTDAFEGLCKGD